MIWNPGWWVYRWWQQGNNACFCAIYFSGGCARGYVTCTSNDYISGKLNWSFCVSICMDGAAAITRQLSGFTTREKRLLLIVNLHTVSSIEKCRLAEKCHLNLTMFDRLWLKLSTPLKHATLTHVCLRSSVRRWTQSSHAFSYTQKWDGFLKQDHWPECFSSKGHSRDFF